MKNNFRILVAVIAVMVTVATAQAQQYYWSNLAGKPGSSGVTDGAGSAARFNIPYATAIDSAGNVYVADSSNHTIRKLTLSGSTWTVMTLAGAPGISGTDDGQGSSAHFNIPTGVAVDSGNNVYVADSGNMTIRKVTPQGVVTTLAGTPGQSGFADDTGSAAVFGSPTSVAVDGAGNVFVADAPNHVIRKVTTGGVVTTFAGTPGQAGYADGLANAALFNTPTGVAVDGAGNVYVADNLNHLIRKITPGGTVSTLAGTPVLYGTFDGTGSAAMFNYPAGVSVDGSGNVFVADTCNHTIRKVTSTGVVTTFAGTVINGTSTSVGSSGTAGYKDGAGSAALFNYPMGVGVDSGGNVYVADSTNNAIRKITSAGYVMTIAGGPNQSGSTNGTGTGALFNNPNGVTVSGSTVYVADTNNHILRQVTSVGVVTTIAGKGTAGSADGAGTAAIFNYPYGAVADSSGNMFVADTFNHTIRKATLSGTVWTVTTISGYNVSGTSAGMPGSADGTGTNARFCNPTGITLDGGGKLYVADSYNHTIRKLTLTGSNWVSTTLVGSAGISGTSDGTSAQFNYPTGVAVDSGSNIFVADSGNYTIRKITLSGSTWSATTLAGTPGVSGSSDGIGSAAQFGYPTGIAVDKNGNVYVTDKGNCTIRMITPGGLVTTIGGAPGVVGGSDGIGSAALFAYPYSLAVDANGNVFVADSGNNRISMGSFIGSGSASGITGTSATLNGMANPNGVATNAYFRYGTTTAYGSTSGTQAIGSGTSFVPVNATLSGLTPNTTYHYQLVLVNANGTYYGADQTFFTPPTQIPAITSATTVTGTNNLPMSYQIVATNSATSFGASPLPPGLSVDTNTGLISGTPTSTGTTIVTLSATNIIGSVTRALTLKVLDLPIPPITSGTTAQGVKGSTFTYLITSSIYTASYSATGLPLGVAVNPSTGIISGTPTQSGTFFATVGAINASGTGSITLALTITPTYYWSNFVGKPNATGTADGTGTNARFAYPTGGAMDSVGNLYVTDNFNHAIRQVTPAGVVTTIAGTPGVSGSADGVGSVAQFDNPASVALDSGGNLYVVDNGNNAIRKMTLSGTTWTVSTLAGTPGVSGTADGPGNTAQFNWPQGIAVDSGSNVYVADSSNSTIRKITPTGTVSTFAGTVGTAGSKDATGVAAWFKFPMGLAVDSGNNIYVADYGNNTIRKITPAGVVTTIAGKAGSTSFSDGVGNGAFFIQPSGVRVDGNGNLYVADTSSNCIRKMMLSGTSWIVTTIGGFYGGFGSADGLGTAAQFGNMNDVAVDSVGNVFVLDSGNSRISKGILPPVISGTLTATGTTGVAFSYQIAASFSPTSYNATGLPSGLNLSSASGLISGTATTSGTFFSTLSATNLAGVGTATLVLTMTPASSSFNSWKNQKFTVTELLDPNISGSSATPAGDGISNLIKYALGLEPKVRYSGAAVLPSTQPQVVSGTNVLTFTFTRDTKALDVSYCVQAANDLSGTWTAIDPLDVANQVSVLPNTPAPGIQTITVKDIQPANSSSRRFMRLRLIIP